MTCPVVFGLRMNGGVAEDFAGRGLEDPAFQAFGKAKQVDRAVHRRFGGLYRIMLIVNWRCGTGEIVDFIDLDVQRKVTSWRMNSKRGFV